MSTAHADSLKTYFWMVHYVTPESAPVQDGGELKPIRAGIPKFVVVVHRNQYGRHTVGFNMPRENEETPDPGTFRGTPECRNRIIGFYASAEEANKHLTEELWAKLRSIGAVYAELHAMKLDVAESEVQPLRLVA